MFEIFILELGIRHFSRMRILQWLKMQQQPQKSIKVLITNINIKNTSTNNDYLNLIYLSRNLSKTAYFYFIEKPFKSFLTYTS